MKRSVEKRILQYNRSARYFLFGAAAAGFFSAVIAVTQAAILSNVVDRVFRKQQTLADVTFLLVDLLLLAGVRAAILWCSDMLAQRSASCLKGSLREQLTRHLFALGPGFTRSERSGELTHVLVEGVEALDEYITSYQPARLLAYSVPIFVLLVILLIDQLTTPILLFTGPVLVLLLALIGSRTKAITDKRFIELSWMSAFFMDMLQGLATLKMFGRSREQIENIREISQRYGSTTMEVLRTAFQTSLVLEWGGTVATALVAVEVSLRLMNGLLPFDRALAVLIITPEFFLPLRLLATRYHAGTAGKAAVERVFAILDQPIQQTPVRLARRTLPTCMDIRFEHVSFAYEGGQRPALDGFSLHIPQGRMVALAGASGAGKSTAAQLLLRFIEPEMGTISIDGMRLDTIDLHAWRECVAWVPQIPHLFHGTVRDNLRLAKPEASEQDIVAAAQAAQAHEFISQLPQGYATQLGEGGSRLSGGQRQRLAIARAFLKDAPLLILDEATSHLDAESEAAIQDALMRLRRGRTVLVIAHSLRFVYAADQVALVDRGRVVEVDAPGLLLAKDGPYRKLVASYEGGEL